MQAILSAITNLQQPICPVVPPKPKTKLQQILALLTSNAGNENSNSGGGGGGRRNNNNNNNSGGGKNNNNNNNNNSGGGNNSNNTRSKGRKVSTKPNVRYKYYCWSHGVNPSHNSCQCTNPVPGHQNAAIYTNQMNGWQTNAARWCGFVTDQ